MFMIIEIRYGLKQVSVDTESCHPLLLDFNILLLQWVAAMTFQQLLVLNEQNFALKNINIPTDNKERSNWRYV